MKVAADVASPPSVVQLGGESESAMLLNTFGIIFGVANKRSIAWATAQALREAGARLAFTYQGERQCQMSAWSRSEVLTLISLVVVFVTCAAALLIVPEFRRWVGLEKRPNEKDILIFTPRNKGEIIRFSDEATPLKRPVVGKVTGFSEEEIERLGLQVEVLIKTDKWYFQGAVPVLNNGKWKLDEASFGGEKHVVKAILKDKDSRDLVSRDIEVKAV